MLSARTLRDRGNCEGTSRRDFLRVGALGLGSLTLSDVLRSRAEAAASGVSTRDTSVVWLWLGGGPTQPSQGAITAPHTGGPRVVAAGTQATKAQFKSGGVKAGTPSVSLSRATAEMSKYSRCFSGIRSACLSSTKESITFLVFSLNLL